MRIFVKRSIVKKNFALLPRRISSLLVLVFLFASIVSIGASVFFSPALAEAQGSEKGVLQRHHALVQEAIGVQHRHLNWLMRIPDVVGTGVGIGSDGLPAIKVFTARHGVKGIPEWLESTPVQVEVTGMVVALGDTISRQRPAPIGVSTGHPDITAGTIGARVKDAAGNVYALSNNHVYANQNEANIGDIVLQPGPYDGGVYPGDRIGTLYDFMPIDFTFAGENYIDAAIALSSTSDLGNATLEDGYGVPNSAIFGDANGDGLFDNINDLLNLPVQKYGRTTGVTKGEVSAINVYVEVCYEQLWIFCIKSAYFYDQIQISGSGFSGGGDSGSLIVTDDANKNPVGLLFAGSDTTTFANRIDFVLDAFGVTIDDGTGTAPERPAAPTDLSATAFNATEIDLTWSDKSTNEAGFKIERCTGSGCADFVQIATVGGNVSTYWDTGLSPNTSYSYRVRSYNSAGDSDYSNTSSATTPKPPVAPSNLTATAVSRNQIKLAWKDNSNDEQTFAIERCRGASCTNFALIANVAPNITTYNNTGLIRNTTYRYRVRAHNKAGDSAYSNIATAKTAR